MRQFNVTETKIPTLERLTPRRTWTRKNMRPPYKGLWCQIPMKLLVGSRGSSRVNDFHS